MKPIFPQQLRGLFAGFVKLEALLGPQSVACSCSEGFELKIPMFGFKYEMRASCTVHVMLHTHSSWMEFSELEEDPRSCNVVVFKDASELRLMQSVIWSIGCFGPGKRAGAWKRGLKVSEMVLCLFVCMFRFVCGFIASMPRPY